MTVRTYISNIADLDLTEGKYDRSDFEKVAQEIPAERKDEAFRAFMIGRVVGREFHINVRWETFGGKSDERIAEIINAAITKNRNSKGAKAVKNKYGAAAAERITGHKIR